MITTKADLSKTPCWVQLAGADEYSIPGISRPEVDPLEPKVKVLPAISPGNSSDLLMPVLL